VYRRIVWYSFEKDNENASTIPLDVDSAKNIIRLNQEGIIVKDLEASNGIQSKTPVINYQNAAGEDSINRFEEKKRKKKKKNNKMIVVNKVSDDQEQKAIATKQSKEEGKPLNLQSGNGKNRRNKNQR